MTRKERELQRILGQLRRRGDVKWMLFYDRRFPLHYDIHVRSYRPRQRIQRVWFYGKRIQFN